jgi:hypothetical protein
MRKDHTAPDWAVMIETIEASGLTLKQIGDACGFQITANMLRHYRRGTQPLYWRGEAIVVLWMRATGKARELLPTNQVSAPYRVPQGARAPAVVVALPELAAARAVPAGDDHRREGRNVLRNAGMGDRRKAKRAPAQPEPKEPAAKAPRVRKTGRPEAADA